MRLSTACATVRLFSPISSTAVPSTASRPLLVAAPVRSSLPLSMVATSRRRTGVPLGLAMTTLPMSAASRSCPGARTRYCSPLRSM